MLRDELLRHARAMRRAPTVAEARLWRALRAKQVDGGKFRRQAPVGPFIVDFYCPAARLVIEVDGATHAAPEADAARDTWLRAKGLTVLRVWNNEVTGNLDGVLAVIAEALQKALPPTSRRPSPDPLPFREGEKVKHPPVPGGGEE